jgi:hypothetical protein
MSGVAASFSPAVASPWTCMIAAYRQ